MYSDKIQYSVFGASHSESIGVSINGVNFGESIDVAKLQNFLNRRKATDEIFSTKRKEDDQIVVESGIENGMSTGGEIIAKIYNKNVKPHDYEQFKNCPRPSHADYVARCKYGDSYDVSGGGKFSGRMTASLCIVGGIALQLLEKKGIKIGAYVQSIGKVEGKGYKFAEIDKEATLNAGKKTFPILDDSYKTAMLREIEGAYNSGDSCGGVVECVVFGMPVGAGDVMQNSLESKISQSVFSIPAVKGIEFGSGFALSTMRGSSANDQFYFDENGEVKTSTNHNGGINGGLANGMPITVRVAFKPTPSISLPQKTVNLKTGENTTITIKGRHDCCFISRAVPVVEGMVAIAILNSVLNVG